MIEYENLYKVNEPFQKEFERFFSDFLNKGRYILDEQVELFEREFAGYTGSKYCVGVASGLDALYLSLKVLDLPRGSEVIVPSNTYIATILSVLQAGLVPVLVEPERTTYTIDPGRLTAAITPKTKVILVVHLYGKPCKMDQIARVANDNGLEIIEDCAQSHGASLHSKITGTWGIAGAFSFYPTKNLGGLGDGGAVVTDNEAVAAGIRSLRNYGSRVKNYNEKIGVNSRLDELQAGFLRIKLKSLDRINAHKNKLAAIYREELAAPGIIKPVVMEDAYEVFHIYNIRTDKRDELKLFLHENGVNSEIHYPLPPHEQPAYKALLTGRYPISEEIHRTTLSLPISYFHTGQDIRTVAALVNEFSMRL